MGQGEGGDVKDRDMGSGTEKQPKLFVSESVTNGGEPPENTAPPTGQRQHPTDTETHMAQCPLVGKVYEVHKTWRMLRM